MMHYKNKQTNKQTRTQRHPHTQTKQDQQHVVNQKQEKKTKRNET